jgi:hypothetical protein
MVGVGCCLAGVLSGVIVLGGGNRKEFRGQCFVLNSSTEVSFEVFLFGQSSAAGQLPLPYVPNGSQEAAMMIFEEHVTLLRRLSD